MKKKIFSSLIIFVFVLLCGLVYGCNEDRYAGLRMSAKFTYSESQVISYEVERDGIKGVRVKTANSVFDYYSQINLYVVYILNSNTTAKANLEVNFSNTPSDFNIGASFNFDNPIAKAQDGSSTYDGNSFSKDIVFFDAGTTNLTAYSNEGNKKATIRIEVVKVASSISFVENNYALPDVEGSTLDLSPAKVLRFNPRNSSITNVTYSFGQYEVGEGGEDVFKPYDGIQGLWAHGLDFDATTNILSVGSTLADDSVVVKAVYDNPLKNEDESDFVAYTTVTFVKQIENCGLFYGKSYEDAFVSISGGVITSDINQSNKIESRQNLMVNIEELNSIDVVMLAENNGEEVSYSFENTSGTPVYFIRTSNPTYLKVNTENNPATVEVVTDVHQSNYYVESYKIIASKKTTDNINYGVDGLFDVNYCLNYKKYTVDNYPKTSTIVVQNDTLVKNYSVNGVSVESRIFSENAYNSNVYINTSDDYIGTGLYIDVINPVAVSNKNAKFSISLFKIKDGGATEQITGANVSNYFTIRSNYNGNTSIANITSGSFDRQTTVYVQANTSSGLLSVGQSYYLIITAKEPGDSFKERFTYKYDNDAIEALLESKRAVASIKLNVVQGLDSVDGYNFVSQKYMVDSLTGKFLKIDYTDSGKVNYNLADNNFYTLIDESLADADANRHYVTPLVYDEENDGYFKLVYDGINPMYYDINANKWYRVVETEPGVKTTQYYNEEENYFVESEEVIVTKVYVLNYCNCIQVEDKDIEFNENLLSDIIRLDLSSGFDTYLTLTYSPSDANLDNLELLTSQPNVVKAEFEKDSNGREIKNKIILTALSVGEAEIGIIIPSKNKRYTIPVGVYNPITNFYATLSNTSFASGVGYYKLDTSTKKNLELAVVSYGKTIGLSLSTLPLNADEYTLKYELFEATNTDGYVKTDFINDYTIYFNGETSSDLPILNHENYFTYNCANNTFIFPNADAVSRVYAMCITLINLDGTFITRTIFLESYAPVENIESSLDKVKLYTPNTIAYTRKEFSILAENLNSTFEYKSSDPTVIGVKVEVNKNSRAHATYNFDNSGTLRVIYGSESEAFFVINGQLTNLTNKNILLPISTFKDDEGFFWFKLNENYKYNNSNNVIFLVFEVTEFSNIFSKTAVVYVSDAVLTNKIVTNAEEDLYFKFGVTEDKHFDVEILPNNVYDKTLLIKTFEVVQLGNTNYYVETSKVGLPNGCVDGSLVEESVNSGIYKLNISPRRAGNSVIVVIPQDKIITNANYNAWENKNYISVGLLSEEDFIDNFYYVFDGHNYVICEEYSATTSYFILATNVDEFLTVWHDYLAVYIAIADGIKVPYRIATIDELKEVSSTSESVTRKYVLVANLLWNTLDNWEPIGNYYQVDLSPEDFQARKHYYKRADGSFMQEAFYNESHAPYYEYGFNGYFSGKYVFNDIKNGARETYSTIGNVASVKQIDCANLGAQGFFSLLGEDAVVEDISFGYNFYQPNISGFYVFGGVTGVNYGTIINASVNFNNFKLAINDGAVIGGVAGVNLGVIKNSSTNANINGKLAVDIKGLTLLPDKIDMKITGIITDDIFHNYIYIGGMVGLNENVILGSFTCDGEPVPLYNEAGFDSSLNLEISKSNIDLDGNAITSCIGGAVGKNLGYINNVSIQGTVNASDFNCVGGLVGVASCKEKFNSNLNEIDEDGNIVQSIYSIKSSYSTANVTGRNNVGGVVGNVVGESLVKQVKFYFVSAENYASIYKTNNRTFVQGRDQVGGFAGQAKFGLFDYCYVVSYFDEINFNNIGAYNTANYDVVASAKEDGDLCAVGAFISKSNNCVINSSSSFVNCYGTNSTGIFINDSGSTTLSNIFARGFLNKASTGQTSIDNCGYYSYKFWQNSGSVGTYNAFYENSSSFVTSFNTDAELPNAWRTNGWDKQDGVNDGLPFLTMQMGSQTLPLYATTPILVELVAKEDDCVSYIKYNDNSIVLFYNLDFDNRYETLKTAIQKLNIVKLLELADLSVSPKTHKAYRLDITSSNTKVVSVVNNGDLIIMGEGTTILTVSSKLNSNFKVDFNIVVKFGISNVSLYSDVSYTTLIDEDTEISTLKSRSLVLYAGKEYVRNISVGALSSSTTQVKLKNNEDIGFRFILHNDEHLNGEESITLDEILVLYGLSSISDLLKINGLNWGYYASDESVYYYIDVPTGVNPVITPIIAIDNIELKIEYVPYIKTYFNSVLRTILLDKFANSFFFNIKHGATEIKTENNIDSVIKFNQLQTATFTITMYTDFDDDFIVSSIGEVDYVSFNENNIFEVMENSPVAEINSTNLLSVIQSSLVKNYNGDKLESVSITFTLNYKDKINAIEKDKLYRFYFAAASNSQVNFVLAVILLSQDKINQVYGTVYANLTDFPHTPEREQYIYNGIVGALSFEVYPYISNYNKIKVTYASSSIYPMLITQLSYDITSSDANKLLNYPNSGVISHEEDFLIIDKASGQDTYLLNNTGLYSYSKTYFISMLVASNVPDDTIYTVTLEFLNRQNDIVEVYEFAIKTIAKPTISLSFDRSLMGTDGYYYLPMNTTNEMFVNIENYEGDVTWEVRCVDLEDPDGSNASIIETFTPYLNNGSYYVDVMRYLGPGEDNLFNPELLGRRVLIKGSFIDSRITYEATIEVIITLFTVKSILPQNVTRGYMTLPLSTTSPLLTKIDAYYDESVVKNKDSWYSELYKSWKTGGINKGVVYNALTACGYEIEEDFANYIIQLQNSIAKVDYNFNDLTNTDYAKKSGVWFYNDIAGESGYLELLNKNSKRDYNNSTFGFEVYNGYPAVYGYQVDNNSSLSLKVKLSYIDSKDRLGAGETINGIPNVLNYNISSGNLTYKSVFEYNSDFILNFTYNTDLINAIPVSTEEEFLNMEAGKDYRLVSDLCLTNYTPISTEINSFDGNNYTIYITSFAYNATEEVENESCVVALFDTLASNAVLYNVKVYYTNRLLNVEYFENKKIIEPNTSGELVANLKNYSQCIFGGIVGTNNGVLTNCEVSGRVKVVLNYDVNNGVVGSGINGCLVATNTSTGYITNSRIINFNLSCYGEVGGFVYSNEGKIVSSYFTNSSVENLSTSTTAGFVNVNSGEIYECFVEGYRLNTDNDIRNKGLGLQAKGSISGFVYTNSNIISDCYANISLSSSTSIAGFVYADTNTSKISRSYTICYKAQTENNTVANIFAGATNYTNVKINGELNNCYYLSSTGNWREDFTWGSDEANKKATGLNAGKFTTQSFENFDLSLSYETDFYQNGDQYKYVDGYTWVIIEGKPILASTLVDTTSQREYKGKSKNYSDSILYFDASTTKTSTKITNNGDRTYTQETFFYDNSTNKYETSVEFDESDLICLSTLTGKNPTDGTKEFYTLKYEFYITLTGDVEVNNVVINFEYNKTEEKWNFVNAYADKKILDYKGTYVDGGFEEDKNFRANDLLLLTFDEDSDIATVKYCPLENASYYYDDFVLNVSDKVGTRTNPQIIYNYESFNYYMAAATSGNFYRLVRDIDFKYNFPRTVIATFKGVLDGNYMVCSNIAISYLHNSVQGNALEEAIKASDSFGLFSEISIDTDGMGTTKNTIISNLTLNIIEVLSNSHSYVGALAGKMNTNNGGSTLSNHAIILNNITVQGNDGNKAFVQGKNAVGGLVGMATGKVTIKDINCSVNVNATKEMDANSRTKTYFYTGNNISSVAYAGGVIGIFDADALENDISDKNYNAQDIIISNNISVIGGIVGSIFGLVGPTTAAKYLNVVVQKDRSSFVKCIAYAGGLVGENRGEIESSSITYGQAENYDTVRIGTSEFVEYDYFYNNSSLNTALAIGGLVGLNNGGVISNCISTINVRNKYSSAAGGAVGTLVIGTLERVIVGGSVIAEFNIGGLVGQVEDQVSFKEFLGEDVVIPISRTDTIISNCVAANNWLIRDYNEYKHLLATSCAVGGFVGLFVYPSSIGDKNGDGVKDYNDYVSFVGNSYYCDTIYSSSSTSNNVLYLKAAYFAHSEKLTNIDEATIYNIDDVWPYSTRELYYKDTLTNITYTIKTEEVVVNLDTSRAYTISSSSNIDNINDVYTQITLNRTYFSEVYDGYSLKPCGTSQEKLWWYNWFLKTFGRIYTKSGNDYQVVPNSSSIEVSSATTNYYFIGRVSGGDILEPSLDYIKSTKTYRFDITNMATFDTYNNILGLNNNYDSTTRFSSIKSMWINGIYLKNLTFTVNTTNMYVSGTLASYYKFIDNSRIIKVDFTYEIVQDEFGSDCYKIKDVLVTYQYHVVGEEYLYTTSTYKTASEKQVTLNIISKKIVYYSYDEGYWKFGANFYLNNNYEETDKFPQNIEHTSIYKWVDEGIRATSFAFQEGNVITIASAAELGLFAYNVNRGVDYSSKTIKLNTDIDLSGKYWVPIGNNTYPFKGTFDACGYTIKYAVVNEKSFAGSIPTYAGVFGVVTESTISNLNTFGGSIYGNIAGGLIGKAKGNVTLSNIVNQNDLLVNVYGGGIVGQYETSGSGKNISLNNEITNAGRILFNPDYNNYTNPQLYIGGIVGNTESFCTSTDAVISNMGSIVVTNNKTNYFMAEPVLWKIYIGGIAGRVTASNANNVNCSNIEKITNYGQISVTTNCHTLNLGGIFGELFSNVISVGKNSSGIKGQLNNSGDLIVSYKNSLAEARDAFSKRYSEANVGGIVGNSKAANINYAGNDASIDVTVTTTTIGHVSLGGIVGNLCYENSTGAAEQTVNECYNSGDISVLTISDRTSVGLGGIVGFANITDRRANKPNDIIEKYITNCYNSDPLKADGNSHLFMGGIIGGGYDDITGLGTSQFIASINSLSQKNKQIQVSKCLNYGQVASTNYTGVINAIGSIVGMSNAGDISYAVQQDNYYVKGCAYSGQNIFTSTTIFERKESSSDYIYNMMEDDGAESKLAETLKIEIGYTNDIYHEWSTDIWVQQYDTWYPSLRNNVAKFSWSERQEKTNQEKGYYLIKTAEELSYIAYQINVGNIDSSDVYIQLQNSIDLSGRYWVPIGNEQYAFKGTFNGMGYSIKNLTIDGGSYGGLFGIVLDATIYNFGLENPIIKNVRYAGGIVYTATNSRIERVYTDILDNKSAQISAIVGVGGLAYALIDCKPLDENNNLGGLYRGFNNVPINNMSVELQSVEQTGGLVGVVVNSRLENCYNNSKGNISGNAIKTYFSDVSENILIAGSTNESSYMVNVFNLAKIFGVGNVKEKLSLINTNGSFFNEAEIEPIFENLQEIDGVDLTDVWTNEYSLNEEGYYIYPYLRGLGKEWKNTNSEALRTFEYGANSGINVSTIEESIANYAEANLTNKTLVKVAKPLLVEDITIEPMQTIYLISSAEDLVWMANNVNNGTLKTANCEFILLNDIDLAGKFWTPIGVSSTYSFQGVFNFNGHVISNVIVDIENLNYAGLFGYTSNAQIINGYVKNAFIKLKNTDNKANVYVGTIVGKGDNTTIKNVSVETRISVFGSAGAFVGGIIGALNGEKDYIVSNVAVARPKSTSIKGIDLANYKRYVIEEHNGESPAIEEDEIDIGVFTDGGDIYCGGAIGYMSGYVFDLDESIYLVEQTTNTANIAAVTISDYSNVNMGGILGYGLEKVRLNAVKNSGKLKSFAISKWNLLGGIVGYALSCSIENAYFDGYLECCRNVLSTVGGIVAKFDNYGFIGSCVNNGEVCNAYTDVVIGGIIGRCFDHLFNEDGKCVYKASVGGFESSIGVEPEYSENVSLELDALRDSGNEVLIREYKQKTVYEDTGNVDDSEFVHFYREESSDALFTMIRSMPEKFLSEMWDTDGEGKGLIISHICLIGCQTSFNITAGHTQYMLTDNPYLAHTFNIDLTYGAGSYSAGDKIAIAIVKRDGTYFTATRAFESSDISPTDQSFNLSNQIISMPGIGTGSNGYNETDMIICFVKLIRLN